MLQNMIEKIGTGYHLTNDELKSVWSRVREPAKGWIRGDLGVQHQLKVHINRKGKLVTIRTPCNYFFQLML